MKHEWKNAEKQLYLPSSKPELLKIPAFNFFTIEGKGNPNDAHFAEYIGVLYLLSYAVKMSPKKRICTGWVFRLYSLPARRGLGFNQRSPQNL